MKKPAITRLFILAAIILFVADGHAQSPVNRTSQQLIEPAELASIIKNKKDLPVIICVGPSATIPNSIDVGMVNNTQGLNKLKAQLNTLPKNRKIVIYCGCCPFNHCPDARPAIEALKELNFTNYYLLDLPDNIRKDWINKGYPVTKEN